jgi:2-iminoacetate synthase ThiH
MGPQSPNKRHHYLGVGFESAAVSVTGFAAAVIMIKVRDVVVTNLCLSACHFCNLCHPNGSSDDQKTIVCRTRKVDQHDDRESMRKAA